MTVNAAGGAGGREPDPTAGAGGREPDPAARGGERELVEIEEVPKKDIKAYDPGPEREKIRGQIAQVLIWALVLFLGFALLSSWVFMVPDNRQALLAVLQLIIGPLIALVGAVTGFYFGEKSR